MNNKWQDKLYELLKENNTLHNTTTTLREAPEERNLGEGEKSESLQNTAAKTAKTATYKTDKNTEAGLLGLVATWSAEFGYVSIHDPTTGEWWDLRTKDAPDWAVREAFKRKELYKDGNRGAYRLTSREIGEILKLERTPEPEGIVEDHPIEGEEE